MDIFGKRRKIITCLLRPFSFEPKSRSSVLDQLNLRARTDHPFVHMAHVTWVKIFLIVSRSKAVSKKRLMM